MGRAATLVLRTGLGLALVLPGCGGGKKTTPFPFPTDAVETPDGVEPDAPPPEVPACTIQKPMANRILTGVAEVRVVASDPKEEGISRVVFAFLAQGQSPIKVGEVTSVPPDGVVALAVDSAKVQDGPYTFFCQVEAADGRKGSAGVPVRVDNTPPKVELYPPSTPPYSNFLSDLVVRVNVSDGDGIGTEHVIIRVNGDAVADLVNPAPGLQNLVTVPTHELLIGKNTVEITANDKNGNVTPTPLSYWANFVPPPSFLLSGNSWALPKDLAVEGISGIETANGPGLLAWGGRGAYLLMPGPQAALSVAASPVTTAVSLARVADLNGDGLEDILLVTTDTGDKSTIQFFPQSTTGAFPGAASWKATLDGRVNDVAVGDLNRDDRPDLAVTLAKAGASVAVALSKASGAAGTWSGFTTYGGVEEPYLAAIGDFTADGDHDVAVTRRSSGVVTVFPVNGATGTLLVGINSELKYHPGTGTDTPLTAVTSLVPGPPVAGGKGDTVMVADGNLNSLFQVVPDPGTGLGSLAVSAVYPAGLTPSRLAVGDADGDGRDDLVTWCPGSAMVLVEWGNGEGGFDEGPAYVVSREASDLTLASLTGGPRPDIVVLDRTNQTVHVLAAVPASARRFAGPPMVRLGFSPRAIAAGRYVLALPALSSHKDLAILGSDATGEAWVHIVAASEETRLPTEKVGSVSGFVRNPTDLLSADLDKNGYDDLLIPSQAVSTAEKHPTMGRLLFKEGASHVVPTVIKGNDPVTQVGLQLGTWAGDAPTLAVIADLKRESSKPGVLDFAVIARFRTTPNSEPVTLFQPFVGQGDGTFRIQEGVLYPVDEALGPSALAAARLTGGSNYDVVATFSKSNEFTVFFAKGLGLFKASEGEATKFAVGTNPRRLAIETLDAPVGSSDDPYPDLVILLGADVAIVRATGKVGDEVQYAPPVGLGHAGRGPADLAVRDMNRDGYADIVVLDQDDGMVTIYLNLAQGRFSDPFRYPVGVSPVRMTVADLDADSCPDIATADGDGQSATILRNLTCDQQ